MKFVLTLNKTDVSKKRNEVIKQAAKNVSIPGFRKGKAPIDKVEQALDQSKIQEEVINQLLPQAYVAYIQRHKLQPLGQPQIQAKSLHADEDWEFDVEISEPPTVTLGDYQQKIKKLKPNSTPKDSKVSEQEIENQMMSQIFDSLLSTATVEVPHLLIHDEANHRLSQLVNQVDKLGLTVEDYAKSINKSLEDIKKEYHDTAEERLKLEFILDQIAMDEKLEATEAELEAFIKNIKDPQAKEQLSKQSSQRSSLQYSLTRQKVLDYLKGLTAEKIIIAKK